MAAGHIYHQARRLGQQRRRRQQPEQRLQQQQQLLQRQHRVHISDRLERQRARSVASSGTTLVQTPSACHRHGPEEEEEEENKKDQVDMEAVEAACGTCQTKWLWTDQDVECADELLDPMRTSPSARFVNAQSTIQFAENTAEIVDSMLEIAVKSDINAPNQAGECRMCAGGTFLR